jgi:hypothetical protein
MRHGLYVFIILSIVMAEVCGEGHRYISARDLSRWLNTNLPCLFDVSLPGGTFYIEKSFHPCPLTFTTA